MPTNPPLPPGSYRAFAEERLRAWNEGDPKALEAIFAHPGFQNWLRNLIRNLMYPVLRNHMESIDLYQETLYEFLTGAPRFDIPGLPSLERILARIARNTINQKYRRIHAQKRRWDLEAPLPSTTCFGFAAGTPDPGEAAALEEELAYLRCGLLMLDPKDHDIIMLCGDGRPDFVEAGKTLGLKPDAARMRYNRAVARLEATTRGLRRNRLEEVLRMLEAAGPDQDPRASGSREASV